MGGININGTRTPAFRALTLMGFKDGFIQDVRWNLAGDRKQDSLLLATFAAEVKIACFFSTKDNTGTARITFGHNHYFLEALSNDVFYSERVPELFDLRTFQFQVAASPDWTTWSCLTYRPARRNRRIEPMKMMPSADSMKTMTLRTACSAS